MYIYLDKNEYSKYKLYACIFNIYELTRELYTDESKLVA